MCPGGREGRSRRLDRRDSASPYGSPGASTGLTPTLRHQDHVHVLMAKAPPGGVKIAQALYVSERERERDLR